MDQYDLKEEYLRHNPGGHFFDSDTLSFFGETMSRMHVYKDPCWVTDISGQKRKCWCLRSYQAKKPSKNKNVYHYFDCETFEHVIV